MSVLDSFTAFIYSMLSNGRLGTWFSSGDKSSKEGFFSKKFEKVTRILQKSDIYGSVDLVMKKSRFAKASDSIREFLCRLSLATYGLFFAVYGIAAAFVYFIPILIGGENPQGESALITAIITAVCAIPMTISSSSLIASVADSRVIKGIVLSFFAVPAEKLKPEKKIVGAAQMIIAAFLGLGLAGLTYFWHPAYIFVAVGVIIVWCLITSNPESGVALTLVAVPFLQYTPFPDFILVALVLLTAFSYVSKVMKRRRVISFSAEGLIALIFCGFILVSGFFSEGGVQTALDSIAASVVIIGAFATTYNLIRGRRLLESCAKIIAASFAILTILGVCSVFYDGIVDGVTYSISEYVQPILEGNNLYIVDNSSVFSVLAIISFPMVFGFMARQKTVKNIVGFLLLSAVMMGGCFIYGTYETVIAIAVEFIVFWFIYSHKTLNVFVALLFPTAFLLILFPYAARYFDLPEVLSSIGQYFPIASPDSSYYVSISESTLKMLADLRSGIGVGEHAFTSAIVPYLDVASRGAKDSGSLWLQILCWSGTGGLVTFLVFAGSTMKNSLGLLATSRDNGLRAEALALSCGFFAVMLFGGVSCIWEDMRTLYLFWAVAGLIAAYVREGREQKDKHDAELSNEIDVSDVELVFHK